MTGMMIEKTGASQECKCNEGEEEHGENKGAAEMEKKWMKERPRHQPEVIHYTSDTHSHLPPPPHSSPSLCSDMFFHCQLCFYSHPFLHFFVLCSFFFSLHFIYFLFLHLQFIFVWLHSRHVGTSLPFLQ